MSVTKEVTITMDPVDWGDHPNLVLSLGYLQTTVNKFGANIHVEGKNYSKLHKVDFKKRAYAFYNIVGVEPIPKSAFPIKIKASIECSNDFATVEGFQRPLGRKSSGENIVPICYQGSIFCNDNIKKNHDNDYNDFVLIAQLYNASTDN